MASAKVVRSGTERTVQTAEKTTTLESMLKLLLFLETELQFKEEILELLLVGIYSKIVLIECRRRSFLPTGKLVLPL